MKDQGLFLEIFIVRILLVSLAVNPDSFNAFVIIMLATTKANIQLPKDPCMTSFKLITPVMDNKRKLRKTGQIVSTIESNKTVPMKTPITFMPIDVIGSTGGNIQNINITKRQMKVFTKYFISHLKLSFLLIIISPIFYIYHFLVITLYLVPHLYKHLQLHILSLDFL